MKYIKLFEEYEGMLQTSPDIAQMKPEELAATKVKAISILEDVESL